jgi:RNA polymerase sigma-70 factor (ECF subfamily)
VSDETQEEGEILDGIRRRESAALDRAYTRYGRPLYSVAYRMLRSERECEEVVQDVFVSLWKKGHTVDLSRGKLFSWLAAVLRNRCIDRVRAHGRRIPGPPPEVEGRPNKEAITTETAADQLYSKERAVRVRAAMESLPEAQKKVLELAFFGGMSHADVAEHLGESLGTVKSRIRYGLGKLRSALSGKEVDDA